MIVSYKNLARLLVPVPFLMIASGSFAREERWYRIELLIFSHESKTAETVEQWDPTPELDYPVTSRFLVDSQYIASKLALFDASSAVDEMGHQTLVIIPPPEEGQEEPELAIDLLNPTPEPNDPTPVADANEPMLAELLPATPSPFIVLARSELEFRGKAAYMQRTGRYQTLFHETWLQPVADRDNAMPIILDRSGDDETWPRLQGSVKFYLSRYLHLETNLWLNTPGSYLPPEWQMPAPPLGPRSLTIIYPPEPEPDPNAPVDPNAPPDPNEELLFAGEPEPLIVEDAELEALEPEGPLYPWRHAVTLKQERRMRSTEVHYIDHPLLGVVVKMSPLTDEELLARATAEAAELQSDPAPQDLDRDLNR